MYESAHKFVVQSRSLNRLCCGRNPLKPVKQKHIIMAHFLFKLLSNHIIDYFPDQKTAKQAKKITFAIDQGLFL